MRRYATDPFTMIRGLKAHGYHAAVATRRGALRARNSRHPILLRRVRSVPLFFVQPAAGDFAAGAEDLELGEAGFDIWDEWSQQDASYNERDARATWKSVSPNGRVTIGTLFHMAKMNGWRDEGTHSQPAAEEIPERNRIAADRASREEADIARERHRTAAKADALWKRATTAPRSTTRATQVRRS